MIHILAASQYITLPEARHESESDLNFWAFEYGDSLGTHYVLN